MDTVPTRGARSVRARIGHGAPERLLEHGAGDDAVTQDLGPRAREVHHRGFDAEFARASVEDEVELARGLLAEVFAHVPRARRTDASEGVARGGGESAVRRAREGRDERVRPGVRGAAQRHRVLPARHPEAAARLLREDDRQRPGPVAPGEELGFGRRLRPPGDVLRARDVHDERVVARPSLGVVGGVHRRLLVGVGGEPVDRFGRHGDESARFEHAHGALDLDRIDRRREVLRHCVSSSAKGRSRMRAAS